MTREELLNALEKESINTFKASLESDKEPVKDWHAGRCAGLQFAIQLIVRERVPG